MKNWIEVKARFEQAPEDWSIYVDAFDRHGCDNTLQTDVPPSLSAYFSEVDGVEDRIKGLSAELTRLGVAAVETALVPEQDWSETWKQFFKVRPIGNRIVICPTWEKYDPAPDEVVITLDPGQAFGTGDHPTTRLCLELLEKAEVNGQSVADIGCGSGVLAIAACKLGAADVIASDIDEQSVEITRLNATLNDVSFSAVVAAGFDAVERPRSVVVSNIISATLIRLAPEAAQAVSPGGLWIVSGIITQNWPDVQAAAEQAGFKLEQTLEEDDWVGATFRR